MKKMVIDSPGKWMAGLFVGLLALGLTIAFFNAGETPETLESTEKTLKNEKKILYVASYHTDNFWSSGIKSGIENVLKTRENIQFKVINMDTKLLKEESLKQKAALLAKNLIDSWQPDVVIASDDNAAKYLIVPYFMNSKIPFVFCGINREANKYGFPTSNITGMVEVQLIDQIISYLTPYAKGSRIGVLRANTLSAKIETGYFEWLLNKKIDTRYVDTLNEWKEEFIKLQTEVDILIVGDMAGIDKKGTSTQAIKDFFYHNTQIPTGAWDAWASDNVLVTLATIPQEQGEYAAKSALKILDGVSPLDIPVIPNKKADIYLNMNLAKKLDVIFPIELLKNANLVSSE